MTFLSEELKDKKERLAEIDYRLERLSRQHEMGVLNDTELRERSSQVVRESQEMRVRVRELERLLSDPAPWSLDGIAGLVEEFQDAFHLPEGSSASRFMSEVTAIAARWVDDLGIPGIIPSEETWLRLAERLNLHILIYPPEETEVKDKLIKATLRIAGEFPAAAATQVVGCGIETATVSTPSSQHGQRRHPSACVD